MEKKIPKEYTDLIKKLNALKMDYAVIKLYPIQNLTDIDVLINPKDVERFRSFLKNEKFTEYRSEKGFEKYKAIFMKYKNNSFYTIHLHRAIAWDGQKIIDAKDILNNKLPRNGIYVPSDDADVTIKIVHVMFETKYFNKSDYDYIHPKINLEKLRKFTDEKPWQKRFFEICTQLLKKNYESIKDKNFRTSQAITNIFSKNFIGATCDFMYYYGNLLFRILNPTKKGIVISLSGNDGCGKTTIANQMIEIFRTAGFKSPRVIHMGQRPFLPTTKLISAVKKGKEGKALLFDSSEKRSIIKEIALIYLWIEYLARYFIKIYIPLTRSTTIITDRYYYDEFIQNNYAPISVVAPPLLKLYPKPDFNIYLNCSYETTRKRKGEISRQVYEKRKKAFTEINQHIKFIEINNDKSARDSVGNIMDLAANKAIEKMSW